MKRQAEVIQELKTGLLVQQYLLIKFIESYPHLRCLTLGPVLGKLVSLTFDKNRMTPHSVFTYQALRYSIVYIDENCQAAIIFYKS